MRIRPYIESKDYEHLEKWIDDERVHALWCANRLPYPVTRENFRGFLEKNADDWMDCAYVFTDNSGEMAGFFCYSVNVDDNTGFLKFVIVDPKKRGTGCGSEMLRLALEYAFHITGADFVQLNVFAENAAARRCYEKVGFIEESTTHNAFSYKNEWWSRCHMVAAREQKQIYGG